MRTESYKEDERAGGSGDAGTAPCLKCGAMMPADLRFCRSCGYRLGEGVEEYTETVRLDGAPNTGRAGKTRTAPTAPSATSRMGGGFGRMSPKPVPGLASWGIGRACKRVPRWMIWVFLPIITLSIMGGMFSKKVMVRRNSAAAPASTGAYLGADLDTAENNGGALVQYVSPPGSAADKAGLLGGDIITSYDGKPVKSEGDVKYLLQNTPVGKTVELVYVRDGETKTTKLTPVSEKENDRLKDLFYNSPRGLLGVDDDEFTRVQIPNTNLYGVQMNEVYKNRPGYIAGLRSGDIVIEFNGVPIRTRGELNMQIERAKPDSVVKVTVMRGSERQVIDVKMGEDQ